MLGCGFLGVPVFLREGLALVAMSFLVLTVVSGAKRLRAAVAAGAASLLLLAGERDAIWFVDRAWAMIAAGWFAFLTLRRPAHSPSTRAVGAVVASALTVTAAVIARPRAWSAFDAMIAERSRETLDKAVSLLASSNGIDPAAAIGLEAALGAQVLVFPALAALATVAALVAAWWIYGMLARPGGVSLAPLAGLTFNDHWVWVFIAGLGLMVVADSPSRIALNAVVFAGGLFVVRGFAVISHLSGRRRPIVYAAAAALGIFVWPGFVSAALILGLADVWLDLRARQLKEAS